MAIEESSKTALEDITQAAFNGILRALEARKIPIERFPGPIIVGIIAWPEMGEGQLFRNASVADQAK